MRPSRALELLARGPNPLSRLPRPQPGQRCHRHHGIAPDTEIGCALCNPELLAERGFPTDGTKP